MKPRSAVVLAAVSAFTWIRCVTTEQCVDNGAFHSEFAETVLTSTKCPGQCAACIRFAWTSTGCAGVGSFECMPMTWTTASGKACDASVACLKTTEFALDSVSRVEGVNYSSDATKARWIGTKDGRTKGKYSNTSIDLRIFDTPANLTEMTVTDVDLRGKLDMTKMSPRWTKAVFSNLNLDAVPSAFAQMTSLTHVDISFNNLIAFPSSDAWKNVVSLSLADNMLADFTASLPSIQQLVLSKNPLTAIPKAIFGMSTLTELHLDGCNLSNLHLSQTEFRFLSTRDKLYADFTVAKCSQGYEQKLIQSNAVVCVATSEEHQALAVPTTSTKSTASDSKSPNLILVMLGSGGCGLAICAIGLALYRRFHPQSAVFQGSYTLDKSAQHLYDTLCSTASSGNLFDDEELLNWQIDYDALTLVKQLSQGNFGEVWLGHYNHQDVVVKRMRSDKRTMAFASAFVAEVKLMAALEHPKIVRFLGVAWRSVQTLSAVTEYMEGGDLHSFLTSSRASQCGWADHKGSIALDVIQALVYLHSLQPVVIHRDLKSPNVLLDADLNAKLSDFGISRTQQSSDETMTAGAGTGRWMAPEVISGGKYTKAADIYSFGVLLTELDTLQIPFHDATSTASGQRLQEVAILRLVSEGKLQPQFSSSCPSAILALGYQCLRALPAERPSALYVSDALRKAVAHVHSQRDGLCRDSIVLSL